LQVEELERRETPSSLANAGLQALTQLGSPLTPALADSSAMMPNPKGIPMATGTFTAVVMVSDLPGPITVPVTISQQTGARFSTSFMAAGLMIELKGELNPGQDQVHFKVSIMSNGEMVGTATGEGTFTTDPTCTTCREQILSFNVSFTFTMANGQTGTGTVVLTMRQPGS
jgi:hypothetical protein